VYMSTLWAYALSRYFEVFKYHFTTKKKYYTVASSRTGSLQSSRFCLRMDTAHGIRAADNIVGTLEYYEHCENKILPSLIRCIQECIVLLP